MRSPDRVLATLAGGGRVLAFAGGHYVVEMTGHFTADQLGDALRAVRLDAKGHARSVIFAECAGLESYDRSVLTYYQRDAAPFEVDSVIAVIISPLRRMVARAAGLGFAAFSRTRFDVYDSLDDAFVALRIA